MFLSRSPLSARRQTVRLACIRHAASVHPEPGSNSSLLVEHKAPPNASLLRLSRSHHDSVVKVQMSDTEPEHTSKATKNQAIEVSLNPWRHNGRKLSKAGTVLVVRVYLSVRQERYQFNVPEVYHHSRLLSNGEHFVSLCRLG